MSKVSSILVVRVSAIGDLILEVLRKIGGGFAVESGHDLVIDFFDVGGVKEAVLYLNLRKERRLDSESLSEMVNDVVEGVMRRQREEDLVETMGGEDAVCAGKLGEVGSFSEFVAPILDG